MDSETAAQSTQRWKAAYEFSRRFLCAGWERLSPCLRCQQELLSSLRWVGQAEADERAPPMAGKTGCFKSSEKLQKTFF